MMSSYSSVFRTSVWGGLPISLPAMSVFAFILFYGLDLLASRRAEEARATGFLALATALPAVVSVVMLLISLTKLGTTCKLCVGVYVSSAVCLIAAIALWRHAVGVKATMPEAIGRAKAGGTALEAEVEVPPATNQYLGGMFGVGLAFVLVPVLIYFMLAPDHSRFIGTCGELAQPQDTYGVFVPVQKGGPKTALEILDPLCPACKAFEQRLSASGLGSKMDRRAILFPLDTTCNWMITENTHPGACAVSEAVLCAGDRAPEVIKWAFDVQDNVRAQTKADPTAAERIVKQRFPEFAQCIGSPEAKSRLNKSMRWAVSNNVRVLTPQLFIDGVKLCDEDVDLGLDYALSRMLEGNYVPTHTAQPAPQGSGSGQPAVTPPPTGSNAATTPPPAGSNAVTPPPSGSNAVTPPPSGSNAATPPAGSGTTKPPSGSNAPPAGSGTTKPPADKPAQPPADKPATEKPETEKPPADKPAAGSDTSGGTP